MAIHWQIPFKSLRAGTVYTVNIYDAAHSGNPVVLKGGARPFTTQEDDDDDEFKPIRTQSGYIRIVDDGKDASGNTLSAADDWKALLPTTDTDRPVTLTDGSGNVVWQGFMQAQNFGGVLYGNPQEREFPVHCPLTIVEGTDINYQQTEIQNFAYLLQLMTDCISTKGAGAVSIDEVIVQGDEDAQEWLLKRIDWQNFTSVDADGNLTARYNLYQCLEDMCRFWGWTARVWRRNLYLTCADDDQEQSFLTLTTGVGGSLATMAAGTAAGTTGETFTYLSPTGDIFASTEQNDFKQRGPNKAIVTVSTNEADDYIINPFDNKLEKDMMEPAWNEGYIVNYGDDKFVHYSKDVLEVDRYYLEADALEDYAAFNVVSKYKGLDAGGGYENIGNCVSIKKTYTGSVLVSFASIYEHTFHDGFFRMSGEVYRAGEKYDSTGGRSYSGNADMWMRLGIGKTRATAKWWNGKEWVDNEVEFRATIGNRNSEIFTRWWTGSVFDNAVESNIILVNNLSGRVFVEMLGSNSTVVEDLLGEKSFDIESFKMSFTKNATVAKTQYPNSGWWQINELDRPSKYAYMASNSNNVRQDYSIDAIYGGDSAMVPCYSTLLNTDDSYMTEVPYGSVNKRPEQRMADRIVGYWATSKRKLEVELRSNITIDTGVTVNDITPQCLVTLDDTLFHPIAISHDWRDDITMYTLLEMNENE